MLAAVQFTSELYPESLSAHTLLINTFSIDCCHVLYDSTEHTSGHSSVLFSNAMFFRKPAEFLRMQVAVAAVGCVGT